MVTPKEGEKQGNNLRRNEEVFDDQNSTEKVINIQILNILISLKNIQRKIGISCWLCQIEILTTSEYEAFLIYFNLLKSRRSKLY